MSARVMARGRVAGPLDAVRQLLDALCNSCSPSTGSEVLDDEQFDVPLAMSDRIADLAAEVGLQP